MAIMDLFTSLQTIINERFAKEVRQAIHDGIFRANQVVDENKDLVDQVTLRQDAVEQYNNQMITEMTDKDVISAPELIESRDGEVKLSARLARDRSEIKSQVEKIELNARDYGAGGDGVTDDTVAIQNLFTSAGLLGAKVVFEKGKTYMIEGFEGLIIPSNSIIDMSGVKFKVIPTASSVYTLCRLYDVSNVTIINPNFVGEFDEHLQEFDDRLGLVGEFGFGFHFRGAQNIKIYNAKLSNFWGDGICFSDDGPGAWYLPEKFRVPVTQENKNIQFLETTDVSDCRRQGVSFVGQCSDVIFDHLKVKDIDGTAPSAAVDFEAESSNTKFTNIHIKLLEVDNVNYGALFVQGGSDYDIKIDKVIGKNIRGFPIQASGRYYTGNNEEVKIGSIDLDTLSNQPIINLVNWYADLSPKIKIGNLAVRKWINDEEVNPGFDNLNAVVSIIQNNDHSKSNYLLGGLEIFDLNINEALLSNPLQAIYAQNIISALKGLTGIKNVHLNFNNMSGVQPLKNITRNSIDLLPNSVNINTKFSFNKKERKKTNGNGAELLLSSYNTPVHFSVFAFQNDNPENFILYNGVKFPDVQHIPNVESSNVLSLGAKNVNGHQVVSGATASNVTQIATLTPLENFR